MVLTAPTTRQTTAMRPSEVQVRRRCACMERDPRSLLYPTRFPGRAQDAATTASPAAHRRPSPQPRSCAARPGSSSDRQRTTVSRRCSTSSRSPIEGDEITPSGSSRTALQGEGRPLCNRSSIRPIRTSRNLLDLGSRSWPQGQRQRRTGQEDVRWRICRAALRGTAARVYQVRAATPGGQGVSYQRGRQRITYRTWPAGSFTSASGSGSRSTASHRKPGPAIEITGSGSARCHRARGHLTGRAVDADRRTAGGASPARPPRRRRHHLRSPGTSTRGVRSLMWYGAGSPCRRRVSPAVASYSCCSSPSPLVCSRDRPRPASGRSPASSIPPPAGTASTPTWCTPSSPSSPGTAQPRNRPRGPRA